MKSAVSLSPHYCLFFKVEDSQRHSCSAVSLPNQHKDASKTVCCRPDLPLPPEINANTCRATFTLQL